MENLPTQQRLLLIYGKTHITLEQAVADWMPHINIERAKRRATTQTLPWPQRRQPEKRPVRQPCRNRRMARHARTGS